MQQVLLQVVYSFSKPADFDLKPLPLVVQISELDGNGYLCPQCLLHSRFRIGRLHGCDIREGLQLETRTVYDHSLKNRLHLQQN